MNGYKRVRIRSHGRVPDDIVKLIFSFIERPWGDDCYGWTYKSMIYQLALVSKRFNQFSHQLDLEDEYYEEKLISLCKYNESLAVELIKGRLPHITENVLRTAAALGSIPIVTTLLDKIDLTKDIYQILIQAKMFDLFEKIYNDPKNRGYAPPLLDLVDDVISTRDIVFISKIIPAINVDTQYDRKELQRTFLRVVSAGLLEVVDIFIKRSKVWIHYCDFETTRVAARIDHPEILRKLLHSAEHNIYIMTDLLSMAVSHEHENNVKVLLEENNQIPSNKVIENAVARGQTNMVKMILTSNGFQPELDANAALRKALAMENRVIIKMLLQDERVQKSIS